MINDYACIQAALGAVVSSSTGADSEGVVCKHC